MITDQTTIKDRSYPDRRRSASLVVVTSGCSQRLDAALRSNAA
jgi:hypothetical protein